MQTSDVTTDFWMLSGSCTSGPAFGKTKGVSFLCVILTLKLSPFFSQPLRITNQRHDKKSICVLHANILSWPHFRTSLSVLDQVLDSAGFLLVLCSVTLTLYLIESDPIESYLKNVKTPISCRAKKIRPGVHSQDFFCRANAGVLDLRW